MSPTRACNRSRTPPFGGVLLCADLFHTQGAAMYAFRSLLALATRAARELSPVQVLVQVPEPSTPPFGFGYRLDELFTSASLDELSHSAGFQWYESDEPHDTCSWTCCDSRIGHGLHIHRQEATALWNISTHQPRASELLPSFNPRPSRIRDPLSRFVNDTLAYVRAEVAAARDRPLAISLLMYHFAPGPLAHAAAVLPDESGLVGRTLHLATEPPSAARHRLDSRLRAQQTWLQRAQQTRLQHGRSRLRPASGPPPPPPPAAPPGVPFSRECAYAYVRWPVLKLNVSRSMLLGGRWYNEYDDIKRRAQVPFASLAAHIVSATCSVGANSTRIRCLYVNALLRPESDADTALSILQQAAGPELAVGLSGRPPSDSARTALGTRGIAPRDAAAADLIDGIQERRRALAAALLITEQGTRKPPAQRQHLPPV